MLFFFTLLFFCLGSCFGSFLNVVALRSLKNETLSGRSYCPHCHHRLGYLDLIPIASYLFLSGKCRYCGAKFSHRYFFVEVFCGLAFSLVFTIWFSSFNYFDSNYLNLTFLGTTLLFELFVTSVLFVITLTDLDENIIPDSIVLPAILVSFSYLIFSSFYQVYFLQKEPSLVFFTAFWTVIFTICIALFFFAIIIFTKGKGMGGGDLKLAIFLGLSLVWPSSVVAFFLAFLTGGIVSVMLILTGKKALKDKVAFGPFLALGGFLSLLVGNIILDWYLKILGV
jgi:leader peptidase (prepilin peptidase)/N-methyltransferase